MPAVTVHGLAQARAALALAGPRGVLLLSPPAAAGWAGVGWFLALVAQARASDPHVRCEAALDCGAEAGAALAAMRTGAPVVILDGNCPAFPAVAAAAAESNATLWPTRPDALDMAHHDPRSRHANKNLVAWLSAIGSPRDEGKPPSR